MLMEMRFSIVELSDALQSHCDNALGRRAYEIKINRQHIIDDCAGAKSEIIRLYNEVLGLTDILDRCFPVLEESDKLTSEEKIHIKRKIKRMGKWSTDKCNSCLKAGIYENNMCFPCGGV